jgi:hypothetical protein
MCAVTPPAASPARQGGGAPGTGISIKGIVYVMHIGQPYRLTSFATVGAWRPEWGGQRFGLHHAGAEQ